MASKQMAISWAHNRDRSFLKGKTSASSRTAFAVLASVQVTLIAAITVVVVALPRLRHDLGLHEGQAILISSGYGLSFGGLLLLGSRVGERYGLRRCLLTGLWVFVGGSVIGGLADSFPLLMLARLTQGSGAALAAPAATTLVPAVFADVSATARALATWGILASVGAITGTLAGGALTGTISWRWCFLMVALAGLAEIAAARRLLPAPAHGAAAPLDVVGALSVTAAMCLLSYGLIETTDHRWGSGAVEIPLVAGSALLVVFAFVERRAPAPLLRTGLLVQPRRASALATIWVSSAATATVTLFCSLYFQQVQGHTSLQTTSRLLPLAATFAIAAAAVRPVFGRFDPARLATIGLLAAALGLALLGEMHVSSSYLGPILAGLVLFPAAVSVAFAAGMVLALDDTPPGDAAAAAGLANTAMETGPTIGVALLASLAGAVAGPHLNPSALTHGYSLALRAAAGVLVATAFATARFPRRRAASLPPDADSSGVSQFRPPRLFVPKENHDHTS